MTNNWVKDIRETPTPIQPASVKLLILILTLTLLGRPYVVTGGLLFCPWCFFQRLISELPRPIALKLYHLVGIWLNFIIPLQKFGGAPRKKIWGQKHAKFGRFLQYPTLIANISGTDRHIENRKKTRSTTTTSTLDEKTWWTLVHKQQRSSGAYWPT